MIAMGHSFSQGRRSRERSMPTEFVAEPARLSFVYDLSYVSTTRRAE